MKSLHSYLNGYLDNLMNARRSSCRSCCRRRVGGGLGSLSVVGVGRSSERFLDLSKVLKVSIVIAAVSPRKLPGLLQAFSRGLCNIVPGLVTAPLVLWRVRSRAGNSNCTSKSCAFCGHRSRITVNDSWHLGQKGYAEHVREVQSSRKGAPAAASAPCSHWTLALLAFFFFFF
jgi:hypothetical protein